MKKNILVIGAGPAGLTAAYELLRDGRSSVHEVTVLEESQRLGGISCTVNHHGNRMDMGGHRFFTKVPEVNAWWDMMLPRQGSPSFDDRLLKREATLAPCGPDPDTTDCVMLSRHRVSRILFNGKFFDYPITLKASTIKNMGIFTTMKAGSSYLLSSVHKKQENSLEDFYINRFGKKLYYMFFEHYTENLWGRHPSQIDPSWGAQRVKGVSIKAVLQNAARKAIHLKRKGEVETSLIEEFSYPKLGPGELWEITADKIEKMGGKILKGYKVEKLHRDETGRITALTCEHHGQKERLSGDIVISSMPLKDLTAGLENVPPELQAIGAGLPYRDYMTVGILTRKLNLENKTSIPTLGGIVPDNWIYVHDRSVKMGRLQIYNNWSPYMVQDPEHTVWMGLEYFCNEGDELWSLADQDFARLGISELLSLKLIDSAEDVLDSHVERVKKAYPAYFDTYIQIDALIDFLNGIDNLYCVGRNGQHRYNNIDHSMCTAFEAVKNILTGCKDKSNIWNVNTEKEYHETK